MNWIQNKLRKWLGIELQIEEANKTRQKVYELEGKVKSLTEIVASMEGDLQIIEEQCKLLPKITDAGMDIGLRPEFHKNWAVFCATGNGQDYVKFVDISSMHYREVIDMAKRLEMNEEHYREYSRIKMDAPMGIKDRFYYERRR